MGVQARAQEQAQDFAEEYPILVLRIYVYSSYHTVSSSFLCCELAKLSVFTWLNNSQTGSSTRHIVLESTAGRRKVSWIYDQKMWSTNVFDQIDMYIQLSTTQPPAPP
jgi:hypothetical protein